MFLILDLELSVMAVRREGQNGHLSPLEIGSKN